MNEYFSDDITFCLQENCHVARCERHPSNIKHPELPHSYAMLYQTDCCPLITTQKRLMSEGKKSGDIQKNHWIPFDCDHEPEFGNYLVTIKDKNSGELDVDIDLYWSGGWDDFTGERVYEVVAYMPLPEPYQGEDK